MSLPKKLDALRYASMVTAVINGFITIVNQLVTHLCPRLWSQIRKRSANTMNQPSKVPTHRSSSIWMYVVVIVSRFSQWSINLQLSISLQSTATLLLGEWTRWGLIQWTNILKLITRSIIVPLIVYILVGWFGYESTGSNTPDVIVNRLVSPDTSDVLMQIGKSGKFEKL